MNIINNQESDMQEINRSELEAISLFAEQRGDHYHLQGVILTIYQDGSHGLCATNGHIMGAIRVSEEQEGERNLFISLEKVKLLVGRAKLEKLHAITLDVEELSISSFHWRKLFKGLIYDEDAPNLAFCLSGSYLSIFTKAAKLLTLNDNLIFKSTGFEKVVRIVLPSSKNFEGLIMPIRNA
jgi:hypothetical protein